MIFGVFLTSGGSKNTCPGTLPPPSGTRSGGWSEGPPGTRFGPPQTSIFDEILMIFFPKFESKMRSVRQKNIKNFRYFLRNFFHIFDVCVNDFLLIIFCWLSKEIILKITFC